MSNVSTLPLTRWGDSDYLYLAEQLGIGSSAGLGELGALPPPAAVQPQFRATNLAARNAALQGDPANATALFYQAQAIAASSSDPSYFSDDLNYTWLIVSGNSSAAADAAAGAALEARGNVNARPSSVFDAAARGFNEGLNDGLTDLKSFHLPTTGLLAAGAAALVALALVLR